MRSRQLGEFCRRIAPYGMRKPDAELPPRPAARTERLVRLARRASTWHRNLNSWPLCHGPIGHVRIPFAAVGRALDRRDFVLDRAGDRCRIGRAGHGAIKSACGSLGHALHRHGRLHGWSSPGEVALARDGSQSPQSWRDGLRDPHGSRDPRMGPKVFCGGRAGCTQSLADVGNSGTASCAPVHRKAHSSAETAIRSTLLPTSGEFIGPFSVTDRWPFRPPVYRADPRWWGHHLRALHMSSLEADSPVVGAIDSPLLRHDLTSQPQRFFYHLAFVF